MDVALDDRYFEWLYRQVASPNRKNPARTYWSLIKQLFLKEFVWIIPNDDNRVEDGRDLRYEFLNENHGLERDEVDPEWLGLGCSFLEMLIGLSRRLAFEADGEARDWFWRLLENLDLRKFSDAEYDDRYDDFKNEVIDDAVDTVIWRTYHPDGRGGLFPLQQTNEDQRDLELWYQMSSYLIERM